MCVTVTLFSNFIKSLVATGYHEICDGECSVDESCIVDVGPAHKTQPHTHNHAVQESQGETWGGKSQGETASHNLT